MSNQPPHIRVVLGLGFRVFGVYNPPHIRVILV